MEAFDTLSEGHLSDVTIDACHSAPNSQTRVDVEPTNQLVNSI